MLENYVVTVIGESVFGDYDLTTFLLFAYSLIEAKALGIDKFLKIYPNYQNIQAKGFKIIKENLV